jgi:hypothetical protein
MTPSSTRAPVKRLWTAASLFVALVTVLVAGCQSKFAKIQATPPPVYKGIIALPSHRADLQAMVTPPEGWQAEPLKASSKHTHQVWLSPTGHTAYGVIFFNLPWPVGEDLAVTAFIQQMARTEGKAELIDKEKDPDLPGVRFVAEGGLYRVRANMIVDGWRGWAVYAGTVVKNPVDEKELELAELARESTRVGATKMVPGSTTRPSQSIDVEDRLRFEQLMTGADPR